MKRFLAATALACVLSASALAGDLPTSGVTSPAPNGTTQTTTAPGDLPTSGVATPQPNGTTQVSVGTAVILTIISLLLR